MLLPVLPGICAQVTRPSSERLQQIQALQRQVAELQARLQAKAHAPVGAAADAIQGPQLPGHLPATHSPRTGAAWSSISPHGSLTPRSDAPPRSHLSVVPRSMSSLVPGMAAVRTRALTHPLQQQQQLYYGVIASHLGHSAGPDRGSTGALDRLQGSTYMSLHAPVAKSASTLGARLGPSTCPTSPVYSGLAVPMAMSPLQPMSSRSSAHQLLVTGTDAGLAQARHKLEVEAARLKQLKWLQEQVAELQMRLQRA